MRIFDKWKVISTCLFRVTWWTGDVPSPHYFFSETYELTMDQVKLVRRGYLYK
jgi:hypothetical protein